MTEETATEILKELTRTTNELMRITNALEAGVASWNEFRANLTDYHAEVKAAAAAIWSAYGKAAE